MICWLVPKLLLVVCTEKALSAAIVGAGLCKGLLIRLATGCEVSYLMNITCYQRQVIGPVWHVAQPHWFLGGPQFGITFRAVCDARLGGRGPPVCADSRKQ